MIESLRAAVAAATPMMALACACAGAYLVLLAGKAMLALRYARRYPKPSASANRSRATARPIAVTDPRTSMISSAVIRVSAAAAGRASRAAGDLATATIVQPILSGDPDLAAALADNLATLPEARFLWLIDADDDEAERVTAALQRAHPAHRINRETCPPAPPGINPKLFKLERARDLVGEGVFVVLDDDTRLTREGLAALLAALDTHTLATGLPCYLDREDLPSRLLAQFVNNNAALTYLPLLAFAPPPTINGMTYAIAPASLTAIGGFAPLWGHLTDDLAIARRVLSMGGTIAQTPYPQFISTTVRDMRHYRALMHRWFLFALLLLREQPPAWRIAISLLHGVPPLLLWLSLLGLALPALTLPWLTHGLTPHDLTLGAGMQLTPAASVHLTTWAGERPGLFAFIAALTLLALRALMLTIVQRVITGRSHHAPIVSIVSELLQPLHLLHALCQRRIIWRTRRYAVKANDDFQPV
jgi:ceramide glucosyltransferase